MCIRDSSSRARYYASTRSRHARWRSRHTPSSFLVPKPPSQRYLGRYPGSLGPRSWGACAVGGSDGASRDSAGPCVALARMREDATAAHITRLQVPVT
eukprot:3274131-Rhodomonas_salina.1